MLERITNYKLKVGDAEEAFSSQEEELRPQVSISNVSGKSSLSKKSVFNVEMAMEEARIAGMIAKTTKMKETRRAGMIAKTTKMKEAGIAGMIAKTTKMKEARIAGMIGKTTKLKEARRLEEEAKLEELKK